MSVFMHTYLFMYLFIVFIIFLYFIALLITRFHRPSRLHSLLVVFHSDRTKVQHSDVIWSYTGYRSQWHSGLWRGCAADHLQGLQARMLCVVT